jgi:hypothetical protein
MDAAAAPSADLLAPGGSWGAERTKIGDRSIVAPSSPVKLEIDASEAVTVDAPPVVSETVLVQRDVAASAPAGGRSGEERTKIGGDRSIVAPSLVKQEIDAAAESSDRGEEKDDTATATPGAVPVAHGWCSGSEDDQTGSVPEKDPQDELDAPPVVSDAVLVQPDLAAPSAPAGGSGEASEASSHARRRRQLVVARKNKKAKRAAPREAQPPDQYQVWF